MKDVHISATGTPMHGTVGDHLVLLGVSDSLLPFKNEATIKREWHEGI